MTANKPTSTPVKPFDVCVVGGAGHIGAPLSAVLATKGYRTLVYDLNESSMATLARGTMPFIEEGGEALLKEALARDMLGFTGDVSRIRGVPYLVITIGTPLDEFHNPALQALTDCMDRMLPHLSDQQTLILRSTVFPGATEYLHKYLKARGRNPLIAFCPERVVQGRAIQEIQSLVQIISATTPEAEASAARFFSRFVRNTVSMKPMEAEFAKLFCNAYRYFQFAVTNQFYMMATSAGLDYGKIRQGLMQDYPRMRDLPSAGFAAGPCLYKDTLQLVALCNTQFDLSVPAVRLNEGMPAFVVSQLRQKYRLDEMTVGVLGMAFKANIDDARASLSYKLKRLLSLGAREVLTTDPFVTDDPDLLPLEEVVRRSDLLVLGTPHSCYATADLKGKPVYDIWSFFKG